MTTQRECDLGYCHDGLDHEPRARMDALLAKHKETERTVDGALLKTLSDTPAARNAVLKDGGGRSA